MTIDWIDVSGHLSYLLIVLGTFMVGRKNKWGWVLRALGETGWLTLGFILGLSSIWAWGFVFLCIEAYNFWKWHYEDKFGQKQGQTFTETHSVCHCREIRESRGRRCSKSPDGVGRLRRDAKPKSSESLSAFD